jgi:hypothetical protein
MHFALLTFLLFLLLRWLELRRWHSHSPPGRDSRSVWVLLPLGPSPALRLALKLELLAWLIAALEVLAIFAAMLLFALLFGPIRPIHEWIR